MPVAVAMLPHSAKSRLVSLLETENSTVAAMRRELATPEAQAIYRQRGPVAEFPNARIKDKIGLHKFHVHWLAKATLEAIWACLTYNIPLWIRLSWRKRIGLAA